MNIKDKLSKISFIIDETDTSKLVRDYKSDLAENTLKARANAFKVFCRFLEESGCPGISPPDLDEDLEALGALPDNFMFAYAEWLNRQGYASGTVTAYKAFITAQLKLAVIAGHVPPDVLVSASLLRNGKNGKNSSRVGHKKAEPVMITDADARLLLRRHRPTSPQDRRDKAMFALMLEHGFRVGEVSDIQSDNVNIEDETIRLYRSKSNLWQTHAMTKVSIQYLRPYCENDANETGPFLLGSNKSGTLAHKKMSTRAICARVRRFGKKILNIENLSPHDLRHYWATKRAHEGYTAFELMEAGGWKSIASVMDYVRGADIANSPMAKQKEI